MIGQKLSQFEITAKLGEGGMGAVYRAQDTKLGREVAIKVLPEDVTADAERLARFEREAQVLAALNHPNIAGIHEICEGTDDAGRPVRFLAMELAEGQDLAAHLAKGAIPLATALPIALQLAQGLEQAHDRGIVHRDLKPANVMIGPDRRVKILDFGLAKAFAQEAASGPPSLSMSPTLTAQMTQAGTLLGTAAYMSPEQARGEEADRRTDIWAFGTVLMEMLTGTKVFPGKTVSDSLAGILAREPDWEALPDDLPRPIRRLLERCLEKEVTDRLQAIGEARIAIVRYLTAPEAEEQAVAPGVLTPARWKRFLPWAVAATVTALALGSALLRTGPAPTEVTRATILAPAGTNFDLSEGPGVAVSPDGRSLAFAASNADRENVLFVRDLEDIEARPLPGTEGAKYPFWSTDGRFVAFFAEGKLKKVEKGGGPPITLAPAMNGKGGTWSPAGVIVFAPTHGSALFRVSAAGGEATEITEVDRDRFNSHRHPQFLPDGEHFLFFARTGVAEGAESRVMVGSLGGEAPVELFASAAGALYAAGHLFFLFDGTLMARPFDPESLEMTGEMFPVAKDVASVPGAAKGAFSVSDGGTLAYHAGNVSHGSGQLRWMDRNGVTGETFGEREDYLGLRLSPDGAHAVVSIADPELGTTDLWTLDLKRGLRDRFTFDAGWELFSVWSPDGERIAFASNWDRDYRIDVKSILTGEEETVVFESETVKKHLFDWSPDGRYLTYSTPGTETGWDIHAIDLLNGGEPFPLQPSRFDEGPHRVSPDSRWLAYSNNASGQEEIYVTAFPAGGRKWQVSSDGGRWPVWSPSGTALYWLAGKTLMGAEVDGRGRIFRVGTVSTIVDDVQHAGWLPYPYDIAPDGQRFLVNVRVDTPTPPLTLVLGFPAELRRPE